MFVGHFHKYLLHMHLYNRIHKNCSALKFFTDPTFESLLCSAPFNHWALMGSALGCHVIEIIQGIYFLRLHRPLSEMYLFSFLSLYMSKPCLFNTEHYPTAWLYQSICYFFFYSWPIKECLGYYFSVLAVSDKNISNICAHSFRVMGFQFIWEDIKEHDCQLVWEIILSALRHFYSLKFSNANSNSFPHLPAFCIFNGLGLFSHCNEHEIGGGGLAQ